MGCEQFDRTVVACSIDVVKLVSVRGSSQYCRMRKFSIWLTALLVTEPLAFHFAGHTCMTCLVKFCVSCIPCPGCHGLGLLFANVKDFAMF